MRLLVYRNDPPGCPETPAVEPVVSELRLPPQVVQLSDAERAALHSWAAKHGFVLRSPADEWLAEAVWRRDLQE